MKTGLLRLATERGIARRTWRGYAGPDMGRFTICPQRNVKGLVFWWDVHEHHGGRGGLVINFDKPLVRSMVETLIRRNTP